MSDSPPDRDLKGRTDSILVAMLSEHRFAMRRAVSILTDALDRLPEPTFLPHQTAWGEYSRVPDVLVFCILDLRTQIIEARGVLNAVLGKTAVLNPSSASSEGRKEEPAGEVES